MVHMVWEFLVASGREEEFERHYGPEGTWVQLFRQDLAFIATELLRDRETPGRYLTIDRWDMEAYNSFRDRYAAEYERIDVQMETLTLSEEKLGVFES